MSAHDAEVLAALKGADAYFQRMTGKYVPSEKNDLENEDVDCWRAVVRAIRLLERDVA